MPGTKISYSCSFSVVIVPANQCDFKWLLVLANGYCGKRMEVHSLIAQEEVIQNLYFVFPIE